MQSDIVNQVIVLCFVMLIGFYGRKKRIIKEEMLKGLTEMLLNITLPALLLATFNSTYSKEVMQNVIKIFFYSLGIHIFFALGSNIFTIKSKDERKKILRFVTIFSNFGFMGYPIMQGVFGNVGVFYASIFGVPFNILLLTFGVILFNKESKEDIDIKKIIFSPGIVFVIIGLATFVFKIPYPKTIYKTLEMVGAMTTPLSMMIVGANFSGVSIKSILKDLDLYYISLVRLILVPLITFGVLSLLKVDTYLLKICVILTAMPAGAMVSVFSERYDSDKSFAAKCVFTTTVLSIITIPIVITLLNKI
ncbi:AEC family transporter [Clostridium malenominatum]|uniref:AEC family transporter n=1 Tax=Clostridium malenominatum TaxID=1539 RepID=A0ABP3U0N5_9CLOT